MLTGKYGVHTNVLAVSEVLTDTDTILSRAAGAQLPYSTAVIGKWHVSGAGADPNAPAAFGAKFFSGFLTGALPDYSSWRFTENGTTAATSTYATTFFTQKAITWVAAQQQPWERRKR